MAMRKGPLMDKEAEIARLYQGHSGIAVLQQVAHGKRLVRGHGPLDSPLVVVGEAPGAQEEADGRPFTGPSGKLLREMFARAGIPWELCYVMNVLPWRPPGNRTPYPFEVVASCRRVEAEIDVIQHGLSQPLIVVTAGATAWKAVTEGVLGAFSEARGHWHQMTPLKDWQVLPVFEPGDILRASGRERHMMEEGTVRALRSVLEDGSAA